MRRKLDPTRRRFVSLTGTGLVGLLIGCSTRADGDSSAKSSDSDADADVDADADADADSDADADADADTDADADADPTCEETASDIEGPYWREGIPVRSDFDLYGDEGHVLTITGAVTDAECNPIPNAVIEMWHADPITKDAEELVPSDTVGYDTTSAEMKYYGQFSTDAAGQYTFRTKKPGWYLNGGSFRPSHIHVKVYVDGVERLTTQIYFAGDPFIASDHWATAERSVSLAAAGSGALSGSFDFTLA